MSLYRQLLLAILISSIMALIGSITSSTLSTRDYLVEQLRVKNQDNASALALTLSMTSDATKIELAMAAQFDRLKTLCDDAIARHAEAVWRAPDRMAV